ncbi:methyl-accepting chemotaxis protein [Xylanibacillus composti]|uniref:Methyl-accepting chemotaxis protein n=1 Tax=Xylanibacillus composti TaxID=1572762 RepID=A0A8J4H617_9BACL|nr:methyl-accepting chemotaxis protein [Xylanibacillus composti]MDT9726385.1 methyl-accepting chemotaxis protein [Xylanibacillus composti]GIQ70376.1 methyl-accepting chemotaxis protein [Xylanibacillus composti]
MDNATLVLHRRNRLFVKILWGMLALGISVDLAAGLPANLILTLAATGTALCGLTTLLTYRGIATPFIKYLVPCILMIITVMLIVMDPQPITSTYFLVYVNIALMTLYANYRAIVFSGLLGLGVSTYLYMDEGIRQALFPGESLLYLYLYLLFFTGALAFSARFSERLQASVSREKQEAFQAKEVTDRLVDKLKSSILLLNAFSTEQRSDIQQTGQISKDVTHTFTEMSRAVESQTAHIVDVSHTIGGLEQLVMQLAKQAEELQQNSTHTSALTHEGQSRIVRLAEEAGHARKVIRETVEEMDELNAQNDRVSSIVSTISDISEQTHMLSLNAAIEAARAGEQGQGFAVVASEVRKLADRARTATEEIEAILDTIRRLITSVHERIQVGEQAVAGSHGGAQQVKAIIEQIAVNMDQVKGSSDVVDESAVQMRREYASILTSMEQVAAATEEGSASIREVCASMEEQDAKIHRIVEAYDQLDALVQELKHLVEGSVNG